MVSLAYQKYSHLQKYWDFSQLFYVLNVETFRIQNLHFSFRTASYFLHEEQLSEQ